VGGIDPLTKLRIGEGRYTYPNQFFQYVGQWDEGKKNGFGTLLMRDGSKYFGQFLKGEIQGAGERWWTDGRYYKGEWRLGEMHGHGQLQYPDGDSYEGEWRDNRRHGQGRLDYKRKGVTVTGEFRDHWPNGRCRVQLQDGGLYEGEVVRGVMQGQGVLTNMDRLVYEGAFDNEKKEGLGVITVLGSKYRFESEFKDNKPVFEANQILFL